MTGSSDSVTRTSLARLLVFVAGILACEGASTLTPPRTFVQPQRSSAFVKVALELRGGAAANRIQRGGGKKHVFKGGDASIGSSIFNLVNNVAGAGILALSAGQAAGTGYIPSLLICAGLGWLSARSFCMIGKACELTGEEDFKGLWKVAFGEQSTWIVDSMIAVLCLACAVIYSGILGDVFPPLMARVGLPTGSRSTFIVAITVALLLPMSLLKDLAALAFTSTLGFAAIMYTVFFITVRALDGSYRLETGRFVSDGLLERLPAFSRSSMWNVDFSSLVLASNLGLAYVAHYNAPTFFRELSDTNSQRFATMVNSSFFILIVLYVVTMFAGYSTFGDVCQGNILRNYHPNDMLAILGRLATGFSILFGFPLVAAGARESLIGAASSLGLGDWEQHHCTLVTCILLFVTVIACTVDDVSLVVGLTGAAMGSFIVYICPSLVYAKAVETVSGPSSPAYQVARKNLAMVPFGICVAALGVYMTLKGA